MEKKSVRVSDEERFLYKTAVTIAGAVVFLAIAGLIVLAVALVLLIWLGVL